MTSDSPQPVTDPLAVVALETERHVAAAGWDQGTRLFALVPTADLITREPHLAGALGASDRAADALSAIEQEDLPSADTVEGLLAQLAWPPEVAGCAIAIERLVVPPEAERDLPSDPRAAMAALSAHPDRVEVRLVAAATRDGGRVCLLRQRGADRDDAVASGPEIAPGLLDALRATLEE